jgi:fumarate hydratase class I
MRTVLKSPFGGDCVRALRVGDPVALQGRIVTGRDRYHKFLFEGGRNPVDLGDGCIFHCGPVVLKTARGWQVVAAGPTTSIREEPYMSDIIAREGVRVIVGKGGMGDRTRQACAKYGCVYVQAVGGAAGLLGRSVKRVNGVHLLKEFGLAEAVWDLEVDGLEGLVTIDSTGASLYEQVQSKSLATLRTLVSGSARRAR